MLTLIESIAFCWCCYTLVSTYMFYGGIFSELYNFRSAACDYVKQTDILSNLPLEELEVLCKFLMCVQISFKKYKGYC